jgi:hypothetical protein
MNYSAIGNLARLAFSVDSLSVAVEEMKLVMDIEVEGLLPNDAVASTAGLWARLPKRGQTCCRIALTLSSVSAKLQQRSEQPLSTYGGMKMLLESTKRRRNREKRQPAPAPQSGRSRPTIRD